MRTILFAAAAALLCYAPPAAALEPPLIGASITWKVDHQFRSGVRKVTFTMRSAWAFGSAFGSTSSEWSSNAYDPGHLPGERVSMREPFEGIKPYGHRFGELRVYKCYDTDCVNKELLQYSNDFVVQSHNSVKKYTAGIFETTLTVPNNVVALLAFLAFKNTNSPPNYDSNAGGEKFSLFPRYDMSYGTGDNREQDWSSMLPKASGATLQEGSWEKCQLVTTPMVYCTSNKDCVDGNAGTICGARNGRGDYGGNGYFGDTFLTNFQLNGQDLFAIAPTFVQVCCSTCENGQAIASCSREQTRLKNYYSPVAGFPLAIFQGRSSAEVKLKVRDYDGHMLRLLPIRSQNLNYPVMSIENTALSGQAAKDWKVNTLRSGKYKFHDYSPAAGPSVYLHEASNPRTDGLTAATRQVLEVQDYLWGAGGIEDSDPNIGASQTSAVTMGIHPDNQKPTATSGGSSTQVVLGTFFQGWGESECPVNRIPKWDVNIPTEIDCTYDQKEPCFVQLHATTGTPAKSIDIIEAPGFERIKVDQQNFYQTCADFSGLPTGKPSGVTRWDADGQDLCAVPAYGAASPCGCCKGHRASCPADGVCSNSILQNKECRYNAYHYNISHVGEERVMCFVATAEYCKATNQESEADCGNVGFTSCYSPPLCVRFNIGGHKPQFVEPTPLEANSQDALGRVVQGRTDVAACLGNPLQLTIKAVDLDPNDQIRIFVDDELRPTSFFSQEVGMYDSSCGKFEPFAGRRVGVNDKQSSIVHLYNAEYDSTITAQLNPQISWQKGNATQEIVYTLKLEANNGIEMRGYPDCDGGSLQTCRQRLLNMNRIVCGYAYDNSRTRYRRWVGKRPTPDVIAGSKDYRNDHSLGSYATERHCWRIKLQAPPVFITNGTGCIYREGKYVKSKCTPFGLFPGSTIDTTGKRLAYANITLSVLQELDVQFVAYDPNPEDRVQLYIMEDPGVPPNIVVGRSTCLPRDSEPGGDFATCKTQKTCGPEGKCECGMTKQCSPGADEDIGASAAGAKCRFCSSDAVAKCNTASRNNCPSLCLSSSLATSCECTGFCPADLSCNRASLRLQWKPDTSDFGKSFFICVVARDNSNLCNGNGIKGTTERGWYGEQQCMYIDVVPPAFRFEGPWIEQFVNGTSKEEPYGIFVGCTFSIKLTVQETSNGAAYGGKIIRSNALSLAPADAMEAATNRNGEQKMQVQVTQAPVCTDISSSECSALVDVTPRLGSEGFYFQLCFSAGDQLGMVLNAGICIGDAELRPCNLDSECSVGVCLPLCFDLRVEKCRYCIKDGPETLRAVMDQYMIDTNWMRIWTLNADTFSNLDTECKQYFDCDKNVGGVTAIDNPELIIKSSNGVGKRILWTGVLYSPVESEKAAEIACRFRTGLKSLQHSNPEMAISDGSLIVEPGDSVCIGACDAGILLSSDAVPACQGIE